MITFESLHIGRSYLHNSCISRQYRSGSHMKVIGSRSRSQELKMSNMPVAAMYTSITHIAPSVLWHCWLGHLTRKNPSPIWPILCWWDVKPYSINQSVTHNSCYIKDRAIRFACSMECSTTVDQMVWPPSLSRDRKWSCLTKCMCSQSLVQWLLKALM